MWRIISRGRCSIYSSFDWLKMKVVIFLLLGVVLYMYPLKTLLFKQAHIIITLYFKVFSEVGPNNSAEVQAFDFILKNLLKSIQPAKTDKEFIENTRHFCSESSHMFL